MQNKRQLCITLEHEKTPINEADLEETPSTATSTIGIGLTLIAVHFSLSVSLKLQVLF